MLFTQLPRELLAVALLSSSPWFSYRAIAAPSVNVALQASFHSPPYLLELLETAAEENATAYFPLLDRIAEGRFTDCETDQELYTNFVQVLQDDGHITDPDALASFQFALSIHSTAPRIEAHYQYYSTAVESSLMTAQDEACPVWVQFEGKQYCSPTLDRAQQDLQSPKNLDVLPFDRMLGHSSDDWPPPSILYADITSPLFGQFHQTISQTARDGRTSYRIRYRAPAEAVKSPLVVNGYGVELALKRTDYIVIDDREAGKEPTEVEAPPGEIAEIVFEAEELADLKPLSATELLGLGLKSTSFIMSSEDPFDTLIKISQDFPKHSSAITQRNVSTEIVHEHRSNREHLLPAGFNVVWMNGAQVEARQMNAFSLLETMRRERSLMKSLRNLGLSGKEAVQLLSHPAIAEAKVEGEAQRYDYRDAIEGGKVIIWLNNIEKDKRYEGWPSEASALLQRTFPGQLPQVRRNLHNVVVPIDITDLKDTEILVESLQVFVKRKVPIQFGIVPLVRTKDDRDQAAVLYHLLETYGLSAVLSYLTESLQGKKISRANKAIFETVIHDRKLRRDQSVLDFDSVLESGESKARLDATRDYLSRLGLEGSTPPFLANGAALPRNEGWLQAMSSRIDADLRVVQRQIFEEVISEDDWLPNQFLGSAATHRNALVIPEDEDDIKLLDIGNIVSAQETVYQRIPHVPVTDQTTTQLPSLLFVVTDLDTKEGTRLVLEASKFIQAHKDVELRVIHNVGILGTKTFPFSIAVHKLIQREGYATTAEMLQKIMEVSDSEQMLKAQKEQPEAFGYTQESTGMSEAFWEFTKPFTESLGFGPGEAGLVFNGRVVGPIVGANNFTTTDFENLLKYEKARRLAPAQTAVAALGLEDRVKSPLQAAIVSSLIARSTTSDIPEGIFESAPSLRMAQFNEWQSDHTMISTGDAETASIHLVASIDPTSEIAQRWIPMLKVLSDLEGVHLRMFLNPRERLQELPIKRFYRHVLDAKPTFTEAGELRKLEAKFEGVPKEALLNLGLDVPPAWLVTPKESIHDLDNIKLSAVKDGINVDATYELENILIEGHSRDTTNGPPPRGVQLLLGTEKNPHFADTIIMANLGYFQFKANPGYWSLQLQPGRSTQIFTIDSAGQKGYSPQPGDASTDIALLSFQGKTLYPRLSRNPGQENEDVLEEPGKPSAAQAYLTKATKYASSVLSSVGINSPLLPSEEAQQADINIFSVASGHLYERMLNIMMVSVLRHTNHSVKFWFIEQFLSPSFKRSLPHLAAHYNFQYALVTYKWPHWLRSQKEKQREIWGYKILFLDVLFPLSLDKVIFVDADQVVRTDMHALVTHDLHGAPYGFTPMCDSRTEMEGFRFWKQGYWATYLRGLPYHISALYVVDLRLFRAMAAGDRLRQQYHQLSADPASLSNLDQDLPNHMQHHLPIHSLPQDWLWCETWCSDASLAAARTIDLCNNPQTKEPKLERARRQVPEWTVYDEEIAMVLRNVSNTASVPPPSRTEENKGGLEEEGGVQERVQGQDAAEEERNREREREREREIKDEL
ncbi:MAG: hypothetical protein Q9191_001972 [Dirinaria sp. TL-2023a]